MLAWLDGHRVESLSRQPSDGAPGCFETMRVSRGTIPWLDHHRVRLSATLLHLRGEVPPELDRGFSACLDLAAAMQGPIGRLRFTVWWTGATYHGAILVEPIAPEVGPWTIGQHHGHPGFPWGRYKRAIRGPWAAAGDSARDRGLDEVLMGDRHGWVVEGSRTNVFLERPDGVLWTPPLGLGALPGVARSRAIALLVAAGHEVQERRFLWDHVRHARAVFCTNAWLGAVAVAALEEGPRFETDLGIWISEAMFS